MTAGAIAVPTIVPLRAPVVGQSKATIDSNTKIELRSETAGAAIYYTLNGAKPTPFQQFGPDAKATLAYRAPFTLPFGKHTVKAVAVSDDGRESFIVTKVFEVEQVPASASDALNHDSNDVDFMRTVDVGDYSKKEIQKLLTGSKTAWGTGQKADSARDLGSTARRQPGPRFLNSRRGNVSERSATNGHTNEVSLFNGNNTTSDGHTRWKIPPNDAMQALRLQRETDFLKCVYCFAPRPTDPFVRFCTSCGSPIPPLPQTRLPPPAPGQMGPCVSCKAVVPLNTPKCLVCEAPMKSQNVPQANIRLADKLLCVVCGTANPPNLAACVTCASNLLANASKVSPNQTTTAMAPPPPSIQGTAKGFVLCTNCGRTNSAEARYCDWCGTKPACSATTALVCSNCRASNNPYAQFCGSCGTTMTAPLRTDLITSATSIGAGTTMVGPGKTAQWVPMSSDSLQLRTEASTQTVGLFYPSAGRISQNHEELDKKLEKIRKLREQRPVVLTAVSPGKGYWRRQMEHICEHLKAHAANSSDFRNLIKDPRMGKLLSATVNEDGFELSITVNFALRGGTQEETRDASTYGGLPTGTYREPASFRSGRRSSLTRYASQDSLESEDNVTARSARSRKSTGRRSRKPPARKSVTTSDLSEEDKKLLKEIGKNGEGRTEEVQQLIDEGADPNCVSKDGMPALHVAVASQHADAIPILIQAGADVHTNGPSNGNTALHLAVGLGPSGLDVIDSLLGCGANPNKKNDKGETPYDLAVKEGHDVVIKKLASTVGQSSLGRMVKPRAASTDDI